MKNLHIRSILGFAFGTLMVLTVVIGFFSNKALSSASGGIVAVEQSSKVATLVTEMEIALLKAVAFSKEILLDSRDSTAMEDYKGAIAKAKRAMKNLQESVKNPELSTKLKSIIKGLSLYSGAVLAKNAKEMQRVSSDILSQLDALHKWIIKQQKENIKSTKNGVFSYKTTATVLSLISIAVAILLGVIVTTFLTKNLRTLQDAAHELASSDGDLTKRIPVIGKNEIGRAAEQFNRFIAKVQETVRDAKDNGAENASISAELSATALEVGKRAENESELVTQTATIANKAFSNLKETVDSIAGSQKDISKSSQILNDVTKSINVLLETMESTKVKEEDLAHNMEQLQGEAASVKDILSIIGDIADQTNLLALNAAIEAARAGEHGRGFAVVADEVRKLAERTQKSLTEITGTVNLVIQSVGDTSAAMQENTKEFELAVEKVSGVNEQIVKVDSTLSETADVTANASTSAEKIAQEMEIVITNMNNITEISADNARSVEEIAGAAEHLSKLTEELNHQLELFKA